MATTSNILKIGMINSGASAKTPTLMDPCEISDTCSDANQGLNQLINDMNEIKEQFKQMDLASSNNHIGGAMKMP